MNDQTLLHRQINPAWLQAGEVTSQAFRPTPKDERKLSVYDGDQISADASLEHFVNTLGLRSVGVLSVAVHECSTLELPCAADPLPFPEHAVIDFAGLTEKQTKKKGKQLRALAVDRGWQSQFSQGGVS